MIVSPNAGNNLPFLMVGRLRFGSFSAMPGNRKCHIAHDVLVLLYGLGLRNLVMPTQASL
jgi:hypothetical protein